MQAAIWTQYGPPEVLELRDIPCPLPRHNEALIRVHAATVTLGDCELRAMRGPLALTTAFRLYTGLAKPTRLKILGQELAGVVEAVGNGVTRFQAGDAVFAPCLLRLGAYAEYACLPERYLVRKPDFISFEQAATLPTGGINGLHFLRAGEVRAGQRILISGAGGSIGTYAVQIARALGADVAAVDSAGKLAMLAGLGAALVIDYRREDFTRRSEQYDVIIDVAGKCPFGRSVRALKPGGRFVLGNPSLSARLQARWSRLPQGKRAIVALAPFKDEYYTSLLELIQAGRLAPVIDRRYPLSQIVEAHRYVDSGEKKGNVVITLISEE